MTSLNKLSATEVARGIAAKDFTAEAVVRDCLDRIAAREPTVHAWANIDPDYALKQARELDQGARPGPLHGGPLGV
jgi:Asp-tRNA(Asn)/Glu-tRNA(Gln) amidotransferase A subunit family amidase